MSAVISECGRYRYSLGRRWSDGRSIVLWVMLNPSTADAEQDDPTIRRCISFSKAWGGDGLEVVNLYAYRSTDPKALASVVDPIGPDNGQAIERAARRATRTIAAWGTKGGARGDAVRWRLREWGLNVYHLGLTKDGHPRHPLYVPSSQQPELWEQSRD